jgi:hypothetical protein
LKGGKVAGCVKQRLRCIDFLVVFIAIAVDDDTVMAAVVVAHPVSVCGEPWFSDE